MKECKRLKKIGRVRLFPGTSAKMKILCESIDLECVISAGTAQHAPAHVSTVTTMNERDYR